MRNKYIIELSGCSSIGFSEWSATARLEKSKKRLFFGASGYESRCVGWLNELNEAQPGLFRDQFNGWAFAFKENASALNRLEHDRAFTNVGCELVGIDTADYSLFVSTLTNKLKEALSSVGSEPLEIHFDYSSMPRSWYCRIPGAVQRMMRTSDEAFLWYSGGKYPNRDFPTAGVDDFKVFSGVSSLGPANRTHLLGLGFDRIRSHAIWSVLDPETLVAFYASPATMPEYVSRVERENEDVLRASNHVLKLPINDVAGSLVQLIATVREFHTIGDVILVPDGPKPLILAASIVPTVLQVPGIVCFHVRRQKISADEPLDVEPHGQPFALKFIGTSFIEVG